MGKTDEFVSISVTLKPDQVEWLGKEMARQDKPVSALIRAMIEEARKK